jgi:hypothetical protein
MKAISTRHEGDLDHLVGAGEPLLAGRPAQKAILARDLSRPARRWPPAV